MNGITRSAIGWPRPPRCAAAPAARRSRPFPSKPITLWVPWAAGGATDISLRLLAELAAVHLGQRVLIENRGGAGGTLAMPILQKAEPDGYTIAQIPQPVLRVPLHAEGAVGPDARHHADHPDLRRHLRRAGAARPARSARSTTCSPSRARSPAELSIATNGVGTTPHVVLEELFTRAA